MGSGTNVIAQGGPLDGRAIDVKGIHLRVLCGKGYGWKSDCGHEVMAWGIYDRDGSWSEPERDKRDGKMCEDCYWLSNLETDIFGEVD